MNNPHLNNDEWLDTALHQWASTPVGKLPQELSSQVAQRIELRKKRIYHARGVLAVGAVLACLAIGFWSSSNRLANKSLAGGITGKSIDVETESKATNLSNMESEALLMDAQQQLDSLQAELMIFQLESSLASLNSTLESASEIVARNKQNLSRSLIKHDVISEWLVNQ